MDKIKAVEAKYAKKDVPKFSIGDTIKVFIKIIEEDKQRLQGFEGMVIAKKGSGTRETFTLRRISYGEGVERTFSIHSPGIDKIELIRRGRTRRAKLYYLRKKVGKKTTIEEKIGPDAKGK
jgi:large subunit ribosomal protein L19